MGYFKYVNDLSRKIHRSELNRRSRGKIKIHVHLCAMSICLFLGSLLFLFYFYNSKDYLTCQENIQNECEQIKTICHINKYNDTVKLERHELNFGDPIDKTKTIIYYDIFSDRYPSYKYAFDLIYLNNFTQIDKESWKCYHENIDHDPKYNCGLDYKCGSVLKFLGIIMLFISIFLFIFTLLSFLEINF